MTSGARHVLREALTWACGLLAAALLVYFFDDLRHAFLRSQGDVMAEFTADELGPGRQQPTGLSSMVRIKQDRYGHFSTDAVVEGHRLPVMVDTGASLVVLTYKDAGRIGLFPDTLDFSGRVATANGVARVAPVRLGRVRIGGILLRDIPAVVAAPGVLHHNLLGMSFLRKLKRFEIENQEMVLTR